MTDLEGSGCHEAPLFVLGFQISCQFIVSSPRTRDITGLGNKGAFKILVCSIYRYRLTCSSAVT